MKKLLLLVTFTFYFSSLYAQQQDPNPNKKIEMASTEVDHTSSSGESTATVRGTGLEKAVIVLPIAGYPADPSADSAGGKVVVRIIVDETGIVISAIAISGPAQLRGVSEQAAMAAKFRPTIVDGHPVKAVGEVFYSFSPKAKTISEWSIQDRRTFILGIFLVGMKETFDRERELFAVSIYQGFPYLSTELRPILTIGKETKENRIVIMNQILIALDGKFSMQNSSRTKWHFEIGKNIGEISSNFQINLIDRRGRLDEAQLKLNLTQIRELLNVSPKEVPKEILFHFRQLTNLIDTRTSATDAMNNELTNKMGALLKAIEDYR